MDEEILQQIFAELYASLEPLDTQVAALLQFLKSKGIVTDEEFAPFLEQAANASDVRWRAARVRTAALISSALKPTDRPTEPNAAPQASPDSSASIKQEDKKSEEKESQNGETPKAEGATVERVEREMPQTSVTTEESNKSEESNSKGQGDRKESQKPPDKPVPQAPQAENRADETEPQSETAAASIRNDSRQKVA